MRGGKLGKAAARPQPQPQTHKCAEKFTQIHKTPTWTNPVIHEGLTDMQELGKSTHLQHDPVQKHKSAQEYAEVNKSPYVREKT